MSINPGRCVLFGVGSRYVYEAMEIARRARVTIAGFVDNREGEESLPLAPLFSANRIPAELLACPVSIPLITPGYRERLAREVSTRGFTAFASLVDSTAVIAQSSRFEEGFSVNAGVVIGANCRFGRHVLINRSASIGHDADVEDFVTLGPASVLCGSCRIEAGACIGAGAVISPGVRIGRNVVVGAGAVVLRSVCAGAVVAGNPAKVLRENNPGYNDVGVGDPAAT